MKNRQFFVDLGKANAISKCRLYFHSILKQKHKKT